MIKKITYLSVLALSLTGCHSNDPPPNPNASLCQMIRQKLIAGTYENTDPTTMKRKNAGDEAKTMREYEAYGCPEAIDSAPLPSQQ